MKKSVGKKLIIIIVIVCFVVGLGVGGFVLHNNYQAQVEIQTMCDNIAEDYKSFENAQSRDERLGILSGMIEESGNSDNSEQVKAEYEKHIALMKSFFAEDYDSRLARVDSATLDEILGEDKKTLISDLEELKADIEKEADITLEDESREDEYINLIDSNIENIRQSFKAEYDKVLEDNTIENIESVEDKQLLESHIKNIKDFKDKLEDEFAEEYTSKADVLIESYEDRIKDIEEAEAEAKRQEEERTQQEYNQEDGADTDYTDDYSGDSGANDNNDNSNHNSSVGINPNNSDCVGEGHGGLHHSYTSLDDNDNPTGASYFYNDGCAYDTEGNSWNYKDLW